LATLLADELDRRVLAAVDRRDRIDALNAWAWYGWVYDMARAQRCAEEARELSYGTLSEGEHYWAGVAESLVNIAHLKLRQRNTASIASLIDDAWMIFLDQGHVEGQLRCVLTKGLFMLQMQMLEPAFTVLQPGLALAGEDPEFYGMRSLITSLIGQVYYGLSDYDKALTCYQNAYDLSQQADEQILSAQCLAAMCRAHLMRGEHHLALQYGRQALAIQQKYHDKYNECSTHILLGRAALLLGDMATMRERAATAVMLAQSLGNPYAECEARMLLGEAHYLEKEYMEALHDLQFALMMARQAGATDLLIVIYELLFKTYRDQHNYEWALVYSEELHRAKDERRKLEDQLRVRTLVHPDVFQSVYRPAVPQQEYDAHLKQRVNELMMVLQMYDEVASNLKTDYVVSLSLDAAMRLSGAQVGFFAVMEDEYLIIRQVLGKYDTTPKALNLTKELREQLSRRRSLLMTEKTSLVQGFPEYAASQARIMIPLHANDRFVGLLNVETREMARFSFSVLQLMDTLKGYLAIALDNADLYEQLQEQYNALQSSHQQVKALEEIKTDMIRLASHDLKNPLSVMKIQIALLRSPQNGLLTPSQRQYIDRLDEYIGNMNALISSILDLERIEQMAKSGVHEPVDLVPLVHRVYNEMLSLSYQRQQYLNIEAAVDEAMVKGDKDQLKEAMVNLISNAIKYTPNNGVIHVRLRPDGSSIAFEVSDNGIGIPDDAKDRIFTASYRVQNEDTSGISGTGWGLYLVKRVVEYHYGHVYFDSVHRQGSTFGFKLPKI
jgi:signal transduction histidine kinase